MNENKICFITCVNNKDEYDRCIYSIKQLNVPQGFDVEFISITDATSMTMGYNKAMNQTDAKYKVYLHQDVFIINKDFIYNFLEIFNEDKNIGIIGFAGSKFIPTNAIWWESNENYGKVYDSCTGIMRELVFNEVNNNFEEVQCIDGFMMITQYDIEWQEDVFDGWHFYDISQSVEFLKKGYKVVIPKQNIPWCIHDCGIVITSNGYEDYRMKFIERYSDYLNK